MEGIEHLDKYIGGTVFGAVCVVIAWITPKLVAAWKEWRKGQVEVTAAENEADGKKKDSDQKREQEAMTFVVEKITGLYTTLVNEGQRTQALLTEVLEREEVCQKRVTAQGLLLVDQSKKIAFLEARVAELEKGGK